MKPRHLLSAGLALLLTVTGARAESVDPWAAAAREGGYAVLLRHATAPGIGDPPAFALGDCATQRNLSETGRQQARAIGERLRELGFSDAPVFTSQWCRCRDTARLLGLTPPRDLPALNSFFREREHAEAQTAELREFLRDRRHRPSAVLVTHQVNITRVADVYPASGEGVLARIQPDGGLQVVDRLPAP